MIKIIGSVLTVSATAAIGVISVMRMRARVGFLTDVITSLLSMKSEICSSLSPMRDVLEKMSENAPPRLRPFFRVVCEKMSLIGDESFAQIWAGAVEQTCRLLTDDEQRILSGIGTTLGRYDIAWQTESIDRAVKRFEVFLENAESVRDRESKVHAFLGIAAGIFAVIVLM